VGSAGGPDSDNFQLRIGQEFSHVREGLAAVFAGEFVGCLLAKVENRVESSACHGGDSFGVEVADHSGSDDSKFHNVVGQVETIDAALARVPLVYLLFTHRLGDSA
jgi:hypothetical protein